METEHFVRKRNESQKYLVPNYASFYGEPLMPPSNEGQRLTAEEFKEKHPVRYSIWNALSKNLTGSSYEGTEVTSLQTVERYKSKLHFLNQMDRYTKTHYEGTRGKNFKRETDESI